MRSKWTTFRRLASRDRWLLVQALLLLPLTSAALRIAGFRVCDALLARAGAPARTTSSPDEAACVRSAVRMVHLASTRGLTRPLCLSRSLVLRTLLRRAGIDAVLRIGVRKNDATVEAHAWVEYEGRVLNDRADVHADFHPFAAVGHMGRRESVPLTGRP